MMTKLNQKGMVSIIVSTVIITIMALIVLSFASIMRRERDQALDRQLNTQAFYAAETAVNDVRKALYAGDITENIDTCDASKSGAQQVTEQQVNSGSGITSEIGCVTVDIRPDLLSFDSISTDRSKVVRLNPIDVGGNAINLSSLTISFGDPQGDQDFRTSASYPAYGSWGNGPGLLRIELINVPRTGSFSRDSLRAANPVFFVNTQNNSSAPSSYAWGSVSSTVTKVDTGCDPGDAALELDCGITITGLPAGNFVLRLLSYYQPVSVAVTGVAVDGTTTARFGDAQAVVDATGRSNDVIYRTKEVIPFNLPYDYPEFGIHAGDVCKLLETEPSATTIAGNQDSSVPACAL